MALIYYWTDFEKNMREGQGRLSRLHHKEPLLAEATPGEDIWAVTRTGTNHYVLIGRFTVADAGEDASDPEGYGPYFVELDLDKSSLFDIPSQSSIEPLARKLSFAPAADRLGMSFQGLNGVRRLDADDQELLRQYASTLSPETRILPAAGNDWTQAELEAAVRAYLSMLKAEEKGEPVNKAKVNADLREGALHTRTRASVEFRMQNISAVLDGLDLPWLKGYVPAKNVGAGVRKVLSDILARLSGELLEPTTDQAKLEQRTAAARKLLLPGTPPPKGRQNPTKQVTTVTVIPRDPNVKAWVLETAAGICEACGENAPFIGKDGHAFLEVHHVHLLADGGPDTTENAVAICPNCHRHLHYGGDQIEFRDALYDKVSRLMRPAQISEANGDPSIAIAEISKGGRG